jgi:hypothetical protein
MARVRPFEAPTDLEVLLRVQRADFRPAHETAPDLAPEVSAIISKAMQLEPEMRYQSAEEMLTDIETVLRTVFRPVGQTELKRWLAALGARDGQMAMAKAAHTPMPGRAPGTGEMDGKDVVLSDSPVDAEEDTSLASLDEAGELRPRMTRQRTAPDMPLTVPMDDEAAMSGRFGSLNLPIPEAEERPGRRRRGGGGGLGYLFMAVLLVGGAAFVGRYFGLLKEKEESKATAPMPADTTVGPAAPKAEEKAPEPEEKAPEPEKAKAEPEKPARPEKAEKVEEPKAEEKPSEPAREHEKGGRPRAEKPPRNRVIDQLKDQMAPDPSLEPAPAPSAPPPAPAPTPDNP